MSLGRGGAQASTQCITSRPGLRGRPQSLLWQCPPRRKSIPNVVCAASPHGQCTYYWLQVHAVHRGAGSGRIYGWHYMDQAGPHSDGTPIHHPCAHGEQHHSCGDPFPFQYSWPLWHQHHSQQRPSSWVTTLPLLAPTVPLPSAHSICCRYVGGLECLPTDHWGRWCDLCAAISKVACPAPRCPVDI